MALKNFTLDLTNVNAGSDVFVAGSSDVELVEGGSVTVATAVTKNLASAELNGFGTLKVEGAGEVNFVAAADMKSGAYTATHDTNAKIKTFDATKASANLSLTTGLVSVNSGVLKGGSGNDTILIAPTVAGAPTGVQVFGGKGADLFEVKGDSAGITIADYNYAEGDKISVGIAPVIADFDTAGNMTVGTNSTVKGYDADGVYKFGVIDSNKDKYDYVAAANNANVNFTAGTDNLVFKADGIGNVVVDASKAAATSILATVNNADITLGGKKDTTNIVSVGAGAGSTAIVDLGYGKDTVSVSAGTALTLKVGREDGIANSLASALDSDDTLVLTTGKISDVSMAGTDLKFGATSITGVFGNTSVGAFNVQFGSDEAKKLAYSNSGTSAIAYSKDVSYYLGAGNGSISMAAGSTDDVVLDMVKFTHGINSVDVTGVNRVNKKAAVDIIAIGDASINATVAHSGVEWKFDLTAKDTAVAPKYNVLDVTGADGVDRIVLSDSAKGNQDSVKGFAAGKDILVLSDVDKLTESTFSIGSASTDVVLQNSKASINGALGTGVDLDVVLADGTAKKVALAGAGIGSSAAGVVVATQKTTTVINQDTVDGIVKFNINEAPENDAAFVVDMTGTVSNAIDYLGKFTSIAATVDAANALIIGNEAITSIQATGSADHGAVVWAGANANAQISLASSATGGDAGNIIWTGALDGASSVSGFDGKDKLYVYGVDGLSKTAVAESFGINVDGTNRTLVYHTGASSMTFTSTAPTNAGNVNVMYMDSTVEGGYGYKKVAFNTAGSGSIGFATDADVYIGTADATVTVANDAVAEGEITAINLSNKGAGSVEEGGAYYKGIHNIDAHTSAGTFLLIGDNSNGANLIGGVKGNAIWGGGDASQNMTGGAGVADIFWFGSKDGHDVVTNFGTKDGTDASGDAVFLYDATSIDAVQITAEGNNAKVVFKDTNSTLTLNKVSNIDDVKFMLNNADGGYDYYKYDSKTSAFVQQKA